MSYIQYLPLVDRIDYLAGFFYSELLCRTVEKALDIKLSDRVRAIRVMMLELNRIASHLLWIGAFLMDLGASSPFFYACSPFNFSAASAVASLSSISPISPFKNASSE